MGETRRQERENYGNHRYDNSGKRWIDSLHSVFANNLSKRLSWNAIRGAFEEHGRVVDVHLPKRILQDRNRDTNFAFIWYRDKSEMERALKWGGHQWIDGRRVGVRRAEPWRANSNKEIKGSMVKGSLAQGANQKKFDGRSYRDVVIEGRVNDQDPKGATTKQMMEARQICKESPGAKKETEQGTKLENKETGQQQMLSHRSKSGVINTNIPDEDMEWTRRSAVGRLHERLSCEMIEARMFTEGFSVQV